MLKKLLMVLLFVLCFTVAALAGVNINTADEKELTSLSGIGKVKAAAIIEYRSKHGSFKTLDDFKKVKGIGNKIMKKLRDQITIDK